MHPKFQSFAGFIKTPRFLILKAAETILNFTALSMQINFRHIISFKVASYSACYLTNGDYIRYLIEKLTRENKVIAAVKKWKCFQLFQFKKWRLHCNPTKCFHAGSRIFPCLVKKISLHVYMQHVKSSSNLD